MTKPTGETPRTDALRTSDYILTRNDCLIGMEKYRALARTLERELAERDARIAVLEKALREARGYVHARLLEAAKDRHSFVSANAAESLRLIDAALAATTGKGP